MVGALRKVLVQVSPIHLYCKVHTICEYEAVEVAKKRTEYSNEGGEAGGGSSS